MQTVLKSRHLHRSHHRDHTCSIHHRPLQNLCNESSALGTTIPPSQSSLSRRSQLAAHLPARHYRRPHIATRRRYHSLRLVHTVCRRTTSLRLRKASGESHSIPTTSTRHSCRPVLRPSLSTTAHLSDSLVNHQDSHRVPDPRHPSILQYHSTIPSPPVTLLYSILCLEDTPP
jgi:hypothetical protein